MSATVQPASAVPMVSILVVVYKKSIGDSKTLSRLLEFPETLKSRMELIIRDNSPESALDPKLIAQAGFFHSRIDHDGTNQALGAVYRSFASVAAAPILFFLDDDTEIDTDYISEATEALSSLPGPDRRSICIPRIHDKQGRLFSPSRYRIFSGELLPSIEPGEYSGLNAIMSGLALPRDYAAALGPEAFSTRSRLYSVDTMFMCAHAAARGSTIVCRSRIDHSLSRDLRRSIPEECFRSRQEAIGIFWTVVAYRKPWIPLLPLYLIYFGFRRSIRALKWALVK